MNKTMIDWIMAPKEVHILIPGTGECYLIWQERLYRFD